MWQSTQELEGLWTSDKQFDPADTLFVDLGYAAWSRAVEHA
jgi:hypothetical protein